MTIDFDAYGGRRFLLTLLAQLINAALVFMGKIDTGSYVAVILGTVGAFIAGNVTQRYIEAKHGQPDEPQGDQR